MPLYHFIQTFDREVNPYNLRMSVPYPVLSSPSVNSTISQHMLYYPYFHRSSMLAITESCFYGLPVLPIFISFVVSLVILRKAKKRSIKVRVSEISSSVGTSCQTIKTGDGSSHDDRPSLPRRAAVSKGIASRFRRLTKMTSQTLDFEILKKRTVRRDPLPKTGENKPTGHKQKNKHQEASITILTVTLVYILFNIPTFAKAVFLSYLYGEGLRLYLVDEEGFYLFVGRVYGEFGDFWNYSWLGVYALLPLLNATTNPLVYYHRMAPFRRWVRGQGNTVARCFSKRKHDFLSTLNESLYTFDGSKGVQRENGSTPNHF